MTKYKEIVNEETGETQFLFNAKLLKIGEKTLKNANSKEYKIVTLGFNLPSGEDVKRSAMCYASNYNNGVEEFPIDFDAIRTLGRAELQRDVQSGGPGVQSSG